MRVIPGLTAAQSTLLVLLWAALAGLGTVGEPSLVVGVVGAALACAWGHAHLVAERSDPAVPAVTARAHHRTLAGRAVPRQRDPDAAGHTRSRAPSAGTPAG